jgi:hypothetical protein
MELREQPDRASGSIAVPKGISHINEPVSTPVDCSGTGAQSDAIGWSALFSEKDLQQLLLRI